MLQRNTLEYVFLSILFVFVLLAIASLYSWTRFYEPKHLIPNVIFGSVTGLLLLSAIKIRVREILLTIVFILALSTLGMLAGSVVDFGRFGLQALADLCTPNRDGTIVDDMLRMFVLAPTASVGMLLGCYLGMCVLPSARQRILSIKSRIYRMGIHTLGMFCGMLIGKALSESSLLSSYGSKNGSLDYLLFTPLSVMLLGMSLGAVAAILASDKFDQSRN